jgi:TRAP transporter TAXI family solute receptor
MKKPVTTLRFSLISVLTGTLFLGLPGCDDDDEETVSKTTTALKAGKICSGPTTGTYYHYAEGVIEAAKETLALDLENVSTVGSLENAKGIASGRCDMAVVQADLYVQSDAEEQSSPELKLFNANMGSVAALYQEPVHILVNQDSGITSVADLAGKKVNVGEKDSGTFLTAYKILNNYHQLFLQPAYVYEAPSAAVAKVAEGTLDATFYVAATPISALANLPADANVTLIPATIPVFSSEYSPVSIPATTYPWLYSDITNNIAVWSYLTIGQSIDRSHLGGFLDSLYTNKDTYATKYHAKWSQLDKASSIAVLKQIPSNGWADESVYYLADRPPNTSEPQPYFCSGSPQGTSTKVVKDLIPVVESTLGVSLAEKHTVGTLENIMKLYNHECAMALIQYDTGFYLVSVGQAEPNLSENMLMATTESDTLMPLYAEDVHLIVNTGSGIQSSLDLAGKKINMGEQLSGSYVTANTVLFVNALKLEQITPFYDPPPMALPKVISGEYDAMFVTSKAPVSYLVEADCPTDATVPNCVAGDPSTLPIKLVPIQIPYSAVNTTLSAKHYPWQEVDIPNSPQIMVLLVMSPTLSIDDSRMADFINAVYAIPVGDSTHSPTWDETTLEQGLAYFKLFPVFYRWAAAQYFAEKMK